MCQGASSTSSLDYVTLTLPMIVFSVTILLAQNLSGKSTATPRDVHCTKPGTPRTTQKSIIRSPHFRICRTASSLHVSARCDAYDC
nr:unnamed protein product [Callosobruchus analis]